MLHYLWQAAIAIHGGTTEAAQAWVMKYLEKLLTRPAVDVVSGLRQSATLRGVTEGKARKAVDTCAEYLHRRARQVDYAEALRCGLPIATCVIEDACRSLVQDRLGICSQSHWLKPSRPFSDRLRDGIAAVLPSAPLIGLRLHGASPMV